MKIFISINPKWRALLEVRGYSSGRFVADASVVLRPQIHVLDHLGSVRVIVDKSGNYGKAVSGNISDYSIEEVIKVIAEHNSLLDENEM